MGIIVTERTDWFIIPTAHFQIGSIKILIDWGVCSFFTRWPRSSGTVWLDGLARVDLYWGLNGLFLTMTIRREKQSIVCTHCGYWRALFLKNFIYFFKLGRCPPELCLVWGFFVLYRTLPSTCMQKIVDTINKHGIQALLIVGGFEVPVTDKRNIILRLVLVFLINGVHGGAVLHRMINLSSSKCCVFLVTHVLFWFYLSTMYYFILKFVSLAVRKTKQRDCVDEYWIIYEIILWFDSHC